MTAIMEHFGQLPDPRTKEHKIVHKMYDIVFITIAAVICGAEDWYDIEDFGEANEGWLSKYLELPGGLPSHDTYNRLFSLFEELLSASRRSRSRRWSGRLRPFRFSGRKSPAGFRSVLSSPPQVSR